MVNSKINKLNLKLILFYAVKKMWLCVDYSGILLFREKPIRTVNLRGWNEWSRTLNGKNIFLGFLTDDLLSEKPFNSITWYTEPVECVLNIDNFQLEPI